MLEIDLVKRDIRALERHSEKSLSVFNEFDWEYFCLIVPLSEDFMREYSDIINWRSVSSNQAMSEKFIEEFEEKVIWNTIIITKELSEDFILKHQEKFNWDYISCFQTLSEKFIIENEHRLNWDELSKRQDFTFEFFMKNIHKINFKNFFSLNEMKKFSQKQKQKMKGIERMQKIYGNI